ncbi:MAG: hypothetical protein ACRDF5_00740 [bacterium]
MEKIPVIGWALIALMVGLGAAPATSAPPPSAVPFVTLALGSRSAIIVPTQAVIRDTAAWTALWRGHTGSPSASAPAVDFQAAIVIAIFAGRSPASTAVAIRRILSDETRLVVQYTQGERRPLPMPEEMEATPFHIVRVARSARAVRFLLLKTPPVLRPGPGS